MFVWASSVLFWNQCWFTCCIIYKKTVSIAWELIRTLFLSQKALAMRIRIAYKVNNQDKLEQGHINFPPGLWRDWHFHLSRSRVWCYLLFYILHWEREASDRFAFFLLPPLLFRPLAAQVPIKIGTFAISFSLVCSYQHRRARVLFWAEKRNKIAFASVIFVFYICHFKVLSELILPVQAK